jgi:hypothetical protein
MTEEKRQIIEKEAEDFINGLYNEMFRQRPESQIRKAGYISGREEAEKEIERLRGDLEKANKYMNHLEENWTCDKSVKEIERLKELIEKANVTGLPIYLSKKP